MPLPLASLVLSVRTCRMLPKVLLARWCVAVAAASAVAAVAVAAVAVAAVAVAMVRGRKRVLGRNLTI
jgi:hypothetical protein